MSALLPRPVRLMGTGIATGRAPDDLEDWFPGRWNKNRRMWPDAALMCHAMAQATEAAGWWRRESGEVVDGGLVVGADLHALAPTRRFADVVATGQPVLRASDFLFALPSSCAAIAGIVFGLEQQQTTFTTLGMSGFRAVAFASDLLATGRMDRVVVAALTALDPEDAALAAELGLLQDAGDGMRLAVSLCLSATGGGAREKDAPALRAEIGRDPDDPVLAAFQRDHGGRAESTTPTAALLEDMPVEYRPLAAPSLLAVARAAANLSTSGPDLSGLRLIHHHPRAGAAGLLVLDAPPARDRR